MSSAGLSLYTLIREDGSTETIATLFERINGWLETHGKAPEDVKFGIATNANLIEAHLDYGEISATGEVLITVVMRTDQEEMKKVTLEMLSEAVE